MKRIICILSACLITSATFCAVDTIKVESKIKDVTVFFNGAQITRQIDLKTTKGKHLIILDELPIEINPQSIQVNGSNNNKILSVKHQITYPTETNKNNSDFNKKIEEQEIIIKDIKNKIDVFNLEEKIILDNSLVGKKGEGSSISEIKEAADFYRQRLNEIRKEKLNLNESLKNVQREISELYVKFNEISAKSLKSYGQILITIDCENQINTEINISYYISSAGWTPLYDFRVDNITKPLTIVYNANVYQSSGENWDNVNLKLSANNPSLSGNKPELVSWYLGRPNPYQKDNIKKGSSILKGRVFEDTTNEPLAFANITIERGGEIITGITTDINGEYIIKPIEAGYYNIEIAYIGYKKCKLANIYIAPNQTTFQNARLIIEGSLFLDELEIVEYKTPIISKDDVFSGHTITSDDIRHRGSRSYSASKGYYAEVQTIGGISTNKVETSNYISNSLKTNITSLEYTIDVPYSIPSDGKDYSIKIKEATVPVEYTYYAIPKLDNDAFLNAGIQDWTQLNLLSGKSSIFYQGIYTGESYIDTDLASDTLIISLGRDKNILVKRDYNKEIIDKKVIGNNIKESLGWDITVKNNKNVKIKIIIEDQFPLSERKSIEIERLDYSNAKLNDKTGKLIWELNLEPNDKQVLTYKYSVKYPKSINLTIE